MLYSRRRVETLISVGRLAPFEQWDCNMLDRLFANELYPTGLDFKRVDGYPNNVDGCILIIPGQYWSHRAREISEALARYEWVLLIKTGDEAGLLDPYQVYHRNCRWWVQTPQPDTEYDDGTRFFGVGYPPHFNQLKQQPRDTDIFLSAQNTHDRRRECFDYVTRAKGNKMVEATPGFTQGMDKDEYALWMCATKIAPAPSGTDTPDSFRLYEALEAHAIPIADDKTYWHMVFPDAPFPILDTYEQLPGYIADQLSDWPANVNRITAWWMRQKRAMSRWVREDLEALGAL